MYLFLLYNIIHANIHPKFLAAIFNFDYKQKKLNLFSPIHQGSTSQGGREVCVCVYFMCVY